METDSRDYGPASRHGAEPEHGRAAGYREERQSGFERLTERLTEYLRTRTTEHWVMFLAGLVVGSLLG